MKAIFSPQVDGFTLYPRFTRFFFRLKNKRATVLWYTRRLSFINKLTCLVQKKIRLNIVVVLLA